MIPNINLLPRLERGQSSSQMLYGVLAIATVLMLTFFVWQYFSARSELITATAQQKNLQEEQTQLQLEVDTISNQAKGNLKEVVTFVERVSYPVSPLIDETQQLLPDHTYLREYEFEEKAVIITVDFETLTDVANYVQLLENSAYFQDTQLEKAENFTLDMNGEKTSAFQDIPRYSVDITLFIDETYLAAGGVQ